MDKPRYCYTISGGSLSNERIFVFSDYVNNSPKIKITDELAVVNIDDCQKLLAAILDYDLYKEIFWITNCNNLLYIRNTTIFNLTRSLNLMRGCNKIRYMNIKYDYDIVSEIAFSFKKQDDTIDINKIPFINTI